MRSRPLIVSLAVSVFLTLILLVGVVAAGWTPLLGLDLKGGVSVTEKPEGKVTPQSLQESVNIIQRRVDSLGVSSSQVSTQGSDLVIELPGAKNDTQVLKVVGQTAQLYFRPVLCEIEPYLPSATKTPKVTKPTTGTTTTVPGKGKTKTKGTTPTSPTSTAKPAKVTPKSTTVPAHSSTTKAAVGARGARTGDLSGAHLAAFSVPVAASKASTSALVAKATTTARTTTAPSTTAPPTTAPVASTTTVPPTTTTTSPNQGACSLSALQQLSYMPPGGDSHGDTPAPNDKQNAVVVLPFYTSFSAQRYVLGPAEMTGSVVKSAAANLNPQTSAWEVDITFTGPGLTAFNKAAGPHYQCYSQASNKNNPPYCALQAIELDATVYSAPSIDAASFPTGAQITGSFTSTQASSLALELNYGSLPVRFVAQDISTVSPQIGTASLKAGAVAGSVAVLLVLLYLVWYYRALGLVVVIGICMSGAALYVITGTLSHYESLALTLSGVIGLIVSVGVTADSCVVYFERLKEEIRSGRTVRTSVEKGFNRAFRTILAADFSSFVAALILYTLTVGDVRGFAFFLGLATLLNVVTTYFFTRPLVILLGRRAALSANAGFLGVSRGLGAGALTP